MRASGITVRTQRTAAVRQQRVDLSGGAVGRARTRIFSESCVIFYAKIRSFLPEICPPVVQVVAQTGAPCCKI